ncbi:MAG: hypothetical protein CMJ58_01485 [Planctomycetaceae bacterium]|nr:hypothetical protein [Planctomycetaceae bacterium]
MARTEHPPLPVADIDSSPAEIDGQSRLAKVAGAPDAAPKPTGSATLLQNLTTVLVRSLVSIGILGGSIATFVYLQATRPTPVPELADASVPEVQAAIVSSSNRGIDFEVDGVVIPFKRIEVPVEVEGVVAKRSENCRIGRYVQQGEVLVEIASVDYELEIRRLEELLEQAESNLTELALDIESREQKIALADETLKLKRLDLARAEKLLAKRASSQSNVEASQVDVLQARTSLQTESDQLTIAKATRQRLESARDLASVQLQRARVDQQRCTVRSPIAGVITQEPVEQGVFLQRGATVATVQDVSTMEIRCSLNMRQMNWLWSGGSTSHMPESAASTGASRTADHTEGAYHIPPTPVTVKLEIDGAQYSWEGSLEYFDGAEVDRLTRLVACRVYVRDPQGQSQSRATLAPGASPRISLMTGMFVRLEVHATPRVKLLELPEAALYPGNNVWSVVPVADTGATTAPTTTEPTVFTSTATTPGSPEYKTGELRHLPVRVAHTEGDKVLVYAGGGLREGDRVVVSPLAAPVDGSMVKHRGER